MSYELMNINNYKHLFFPTEQPKIICLMGPTASGKTDLAMQLAQQFPCEIISVDSAMIYRGMDIGTAKPTPAQLHEVPHHLIDIRDPAETYSVAEFCAAAAGLITEIIRRDKMPLLVGGTMMYFKALQQGLSQLPSANDEIRQQISFEAEQIGWPAMHQRLVEIDPIAAQRIKPNDAQRLQRCWEIYRLTGKTMTAMQQEVRNQYLIDYQIINLGLMPEERADLHAKIKQRFEQMLKLGLIEEVEQLFKRSDLNRNLPSMRSVNYRQVWDYLAGEINFEEMKEKAIIATRQLAKRQMTWMRSWENLIVVS
jgi:tRNA dimethylallyltransferase